MLRVRENRLRPHLSFLADAGRGALDLLYPSLCLHCEARTGSGGYLCPQCRNLLNPVDQPALDQLLERLGSDAIDSAFAVWFFDKGSPLQAVQHVLKYGNRPRCGGWLGAHLASALESRGAVEQTDVVVPIPLHRSRLLERGYNQSAFIADAVAKALARPMLRRVLIRARATKTQTNLTRVQRTQNVSGVFEVARPDAVSGRRVLLIDDVMTTGATLDAAAHALHAAGAVRITAAAVGLARS